MKKFFQFYNLFIELEFSPFEFSAKIQKIILQLGMNSYNIDKNLYHIHMNLYIVFKRPPGIEIKFGHKKREDWVT